MVHVTFPSADLWYNRVDEDDWCVTRKPSLTYSQASSDITLLFAFTIAHRETKNGGGHNVDIGGIQRDITSTTNHTTSW